MSSRCSSAPRMQQIYTPRVKDGRYSNQNSHQKHKNLTAPRMNQRMNQQINQNPEAPNHLHENKKIPQQEMQNIIGKKINLEVSKNSKNEIEKKIIVQHQQQPNRKAVNKQQTIHGRKLEYPAEQRHNNIQKEELDQNKESSLQLSRSTSLQSRHFVDRGIKSASIKNQKADFDQKFKIAFGYLLQNNEAYLKERRRACNQKARPKDQMFKVMRPGISTTNKDQYPQKNAPYEQYMEPRNLKTANSFGPRKVCGNSTSNEFHQGRYGPRADLQQWPQGFKLQGPIDGVTTYANKFPNHGDFDKMVPIATFNEHPMGFAHKTNSTHRTFFKGDHASASQLATWNNLHPYGNAFDPKRGTTYSNFHNPKEKQPIQQWPMYDPQLIKSNGKFTTEYATNLVNLHEHELNAQNYCHCERKKITH